MICQQCPRNCNIDRDVLKGFCQMPTNPVVARVGLHLWEEPCISGINGSGTVFFSGCSLKCVFCQNNIISHNNYGKEISVQRLANIFKELENSGAHNINLVNPTHYVHSISEAVKIYRPNIPIVYNSSGYDLESTIEKASDFVDIFLMDMKYRSAERGLKYSKAKDYPDVSEKAILKCAEIIKNNIFDDSGIMQKGLIIRHLVLPQGTRDASDVIDWVKNNVPWAFFSLMSQYTPCGALDEYPEINRKITKREYNKLVDHIISTELENVFVQELSSGSEAYIPSFDLTGV